MVVCVTGAKGFVGRHAVARLRKIGGLELRVLSRTADPHEFPECQLHRIDLTAPGSALGAFLEGSDILVHCAGEIRDSSKMEALHVHGTAALLEAAGTRRSERTKPLRWVQLSSVGVYGPPARPGLERVIREDAPVNPVGEYERTKAIADGLVFEVARNGVITQTTVRPSIVFGSEMPNNSLRQLAGIVRSGFFAYIGKSGAIANYIHVDDVVDVLARAVLDDRMSNQVYNLSNDCTLEEMIGGFATGAGVRKPWIRLPEQPLRALLKLLPPIAGLPLNKTRLDALVSRTSYPVDKLAGHIGYRPARAVPQDMASLAAEWFPPHNEMACTLSG
jgi:nucleoside-diphosphate-sugar epimerase